MVGQAGRPARPSRRRLPGLSGRARGLRLHAPLLFGAGDRSRHHRRPARSPAARDRSLSLTQSKGEGIRFRYTGEMIEKQHDLELLPTPPRMMELQPPAAAALNAMLKSEIE